jgi:hypothetical protein
VPRRIGVHIRPWTPNDQIAHDVRGADLELGVVDAAAVGIEKKLDDFLLPEARVSVRQRMPRIVVGHIEPKIKRVVIPQRAKPGGEW